MFVSKYGKIVGVATSAGEAATEGGEGMARNCVVTLLV